jgi:hypothetical protein
LNHQKGIDIRLSANQKHRTNNLKAETQAEAEEPAAET